MKPSLLQPWYASFIDGKMIGCIRRVRKINKNFFLINREKKKKKKNSQGRYKKTYTTDAMTNISKHSARAPRCRKTSKQNKRSVSLGPRRFQTQMRTNELN